MKPRIAPQHYFPLKVYVRWARISLSQKPKVRPIESSPTHTGPTYAGNMHVVHTPGNVLAPRKSGQQFLPLNRSVRWADMGGLFVRRPNGHIRSTAKTADWTLMVPTVAHGYGLEIPHPHPCRMTCMTCPLDQVTVGCLTVLLLLNCLVTYRGSILFDWRLGGFLKRVGAYE